MDFVILYGSTEWKINDGWWWMMNIGSLFTVHSALVYVRQVCRQLSSRTRMELQFHPDPARKLYDIYRLLSVQWINSWWWAEELPETCRISCRSKFGKLVHLVDFIIKKRKQAYLAPSGNQTQIFCTVCTAVNLLNSQTSFIQCIMPLAYVFIYLSDVGFSTPMVSPFSLSSLTG